MSAAKIEVRRWLDHARSDLAAAEALLQQAEVYPRQVCFLAQQAAEKSIKAALVYAGVPVPRSHDLDALRNLLPEAWQIRSAHPDLAALFVWAVEARYPGDNPEAVPADATAAFQQAQAIVITTLAELAERGFIDRPGSAA